MVPDRVRTAKGSPMNGLREALLPFVESGQVPGAVALVARGEQVDVQVLGRLTLDGPT